MQISSGRHEIEKVVEKVKREQMKMYKIKKGINNIPSN